MKRISTSTKTTMSLRVTDDATKSIENAAELLGATKGTSGTINKTGGIISACRFAEYVATQPGGSELILAFLISEIGI